MKNVIENWWKGERCFAKNPLFWLLTAGACAAAPFTGFVSLAAIPVLAGLAQTGYLPHNSLSVGLRWLLTGASANKDQTISHDEVDGFDDKTDSSLPSHSYKVIAKQTKSSENQRWIELADDALLLLKWLYHYRVKLKLDFDEINEIYRTLRNIPQAERLSSYSEAEKARLSISSKPGKPGIFFDDEHFDTIMEASGKQIGVCLLRRFHVDKTGLPGEPIPFHTSRVLVHGLTLQSVAIMLNRLLNNIFIQKKQEIGDEDQPPASWPYSPADWKEYRRIEEKIDRYTQEFQAISEKARASTKEIRKRIAERDRENLNRVESVIFSDDKDFSELCSRLNEDIGDGHYLTESEHIKELIDTNRLRSEIVDKIILAIVRNDKYLKLTRLCFETSANPNGFIKATDIERLFPEKAAKMIQKLTSPQQQSVASSIFNLWPSSLISQTDSHSASKVPSEKKCSSKAVIVRKSNAIILK